MRFLWRLCVCTLLVAWVLQGAPPNEAGISGTVADPSGAAIPDAYIVIHQDWDATAAALAPSERQKQEDVVLHSDQAGTYHVSLPAGFYDVFVAASNFAPTCRKLYAKSGKTEVFNPVLYVSPDVMPFLK